MGDKGQVIEDVIDFLNNRYQFELTTLGINEHINMIIENVKVHTERQLILIYQNNCNKASHNGKIFKDKFFPLYKIKFPAPRTNENCLYSREI